MNISFITDERTTMEPTTAAPPAASAAPPAAGDVVTAVVPVPSSAGMDAVVATAATPPSPQVLELQRRLNAMETELKACQAQHAAMANSMFGKAFTSVMQQEGDCHVVNNGPVMRSVLRKLRIDENSLCSIGTRILELVFGMVVMLTSSYKEPPKPQRGRKGGKSAAQIQHCIKQDQILPDMSRHNLTGFYAGHLAGLKVSTDRDKRLQIEQGLTLLSVGKKNGRLFFIFRVFKSNRFITVWEYYTLGDLGLTCGDLEQTFALGRISHVLSMRQNLFMLTDNDGDMFEKALPPEHFPTWIQKLVRLRKMAHLSGGGSDSVTATAAVKETAPAVVVAVPYTQGQSGSGPSKRKIGETDPAFTSCSELPRRRIATRQLHGAVRGSNSAAIGAFLGGDTADVTVADIAKKAGVTL